jgi:hypothetical protein
LGNLLGVGFSNRHHGGGTDECSSTNPILKTRTFETTHQPKKKKGLMPHHRTPKSITIPNPQSYNITKQEILKNIIEIFH